MIREKDLDRIILGCGNFGGLGSLPELRGRGENQQQAFALLNLARELGLKRFDTANTYGGGRSEEYLGQWISDQGSQFRSNIQIATKVGNPAGTRPGQNPLSPAEIIFHVENSLRKLKTDSIDIYYVHQPDPATPVEETIGAFSQIISQGKIRSAGLSNADPSYVKEFLETADERVRPHLCWVQNEFSFLQQKDRSELLPFLHAQSLKYVSFSPLAGGLLSGKYQWNVPYPAGSRLTLRPEPYQSFLNQETFARIRELKAVAEKNKRTLPEEALRFVLNSEGVDSVIIGPRRKEHLESLGFEFK
jgi:aryl-alcohol dehydrogenase-like predicted oxidoreductase